MPYSPKPLEFSRRLRGEEPIQKVGRGKRSHDVPVGEKFWHSLSTYHDTIQKGHKTSLGVLDPRSTSRNPGLCDAGRGEERRGEEREREREREREARTPKFEAPNTSPKHSEISPLENNSFRKSGTWAYDGPKAPQLWPALLLRRASAHDRLSS